MSIKALKIHIRSAGLNTSGCIEKTDILTRAKEARVGATAKRKKTERFQRDFQTSSGFIEQVDKLIQAAF